MEQTAHVAFYSAHTCFIRWVTALTDVVTHIPDAKTPDASALPSLCALQRSLPGSRTPRTR